MSVLTISLIEPRAATMPCLPSTRHTDNGRVIVEFCDWLTAAFVLYMADALTTEQALEMAARDDLTGNQQNDDRNRAPQTEQREHNQGRLNL